MRLFECARTEWRGGVDSLVFGVWCLEFLGFASWGCLVEFLLKRSDRPSERRTLSLIFDCHHEHSCGQAPPSGGLLGRGLCREGVGPRGTGEDSEAVGGPSAASVILHMVTTRIYIKAPPRMFKPAFDLLVEQGGDCCGWRRATGGGAVGRCVHLQQWHL